METQVHAAPAEASQAATMPKWEVIRHTLTFPISVEGGEVKEIVLREPDVDGLEKIDDLGIEEGKPMKVAQIRTIIAILSGQPDAILKKLHKRDFAAIGEKIVPLLEMPEAPGAG